VVGEIGACRHVHQDLEQRQLLAARAFVPQAARQCVVDQRELLERQNFDRADPDASKRERASLARC
jgi:hypothetical protein